MADVAHAAQLVHHCTNGVVRTLRILVGYALACLVAGIVMGAAAGGLLAFGGASLPPKGLARLLEDVLLSSVAGAVFVTPVIAVLAAVPAIATILYGEHSSTRSPVFYAIAGGLSGALVVGALILGMTVFGAPPAAPRGPSWLAPSAAMFAVIYALPGACAGWMYWRIAGCRAGCAP